MADDENEIENTETTTEDKAAKIGEKVGIDDAPDYEVEEEGDETLAKEREVAPKSDKSEKRILTSKEKRELRKKKLNEKFNEKDAIIASQQDQINRLSRWQQDVDARLSGVDKANVDKMLNDNIAAFNNAEREHMDAFKEGDGEKATKAMRVMYQAQRNIDSLQTTKQQLDVQPAQQQQQGQDQRVVRKATEWAKKNDWYNPNGGDEDSEIAKAISGVLAKEGFDPSTDDFWDELQDRVAKRLPQHAEEEEEDDEPAVSAPRKRTTPPIGGGSGRGDVAGKIKVKLPTAYVQHLKEKGWWDDPVMKKKMIRKFLETQEKYKV